MSRNIELFDEYASRILADLYAAFPRKRSIDAIALCAEAGLETTDGNGLTTVHVEIVVDTVEWLMDSGYIRSRHDLGQTGLTGAVLTAQGLMVLKAAPDSLKGEQPLGDRLLRAVKNGFKEGAREALKAVLATGTAMVVPAMMR